MHATPFLEQRSIAIVLTVVHPFCSFQLVLRVAVDVSTAFRCGWFQKNCSREKCVIEGFVVLISHIIMWIIFC